jgi:hypothetical protein
MGDPIGQVASDEPGLVVTALTHGWPVAAARRNPWLFGRHRCPADQEREDRHGDCPAEMSGPLHGFFLPCSGQI